MTHVEGEVNPVRDLDIIGEELRLKDVETMDKTLEKMERTVIRANDKKMKPEYVSWIYQWEIPKQIKKNKNWNLFEFIEYF